MASENGSIRYSDLIVPDEAITNLIAQLERLNSTYDGLAKDIQAKSKQMEQALGKVSAATAAGQEAIRKMAQESEAMYADADAAKQVQKAAQEQIKTYKELQQAINREIGTREQNSRVMAEEQRLVTQLRATLNAYQKALNNGRQLTAEQTEQYNRLNAEIAEHTSLRNKARTALGQETKEMQAQEGSIRQLQAQVARLSNTYANMSAEMRDAAAGKELLATLQKQYAELSKLEQAMGVYRRNVGNYSSAWNGLNVSVQQVVRELPSLSMGFNMFFLAISNNLPMLTDEIKAASEAYKQAVAQGQKATPVWKQVLKSITSCQTALVIGITLLAQYSDKIIDWVKNLLFGGDATEQLKKKLVELNEIYKDSLDTQIRTKAKLDALIISIKTFTGTKEQERAKVEELNSQYGVIFGTYNTLAQWYDILISKGDAYVKSLMAQATAESFVNKAIEADNAARDIRTKGVEEYRPFWGAGGKLDMFFGGDNIGMYGSDPAELAYNNALKEAEGKRDKYLEDAKKAYAEYLRTIKKYNLNDYNPTKGKKKGKTDKPYDPYQDTLEAQRALWEAQADAQEDEWAKRRMKTMLQYDNEIEDLKHRLETEKNLTEETQAYISERIIELEKQKNAELLQIEQEQQIQLLELEKQGIETRMRGLREETEQYRSLQNQLFDVNRRIALAQNAALPTGQQQDPAQINAASNRESKAYNYQFELDKFDEYLEETYDKDYKSEEAKTAMRLQMEKERWQKILQLTEKYGSEVTGYQVDEIKETISGIDEQMGKLGKGWNKKQGFFGNLFDMVFGNPFGDDADGLEKEQAFKDSISDAVGFAMEQLQTFADYKEQLADKAVENAEKEVDAAQSMLDAELEARANGYANNVQQAQKELALARKNQQKALQEQQKAQRQKQAIQAVEQIGNLVTATSLIWSQLGFPAAIPAVAIMWGSFLAAKIKAAQMAKQSIADMGGTETYGEGTVELLQGGSHQSGNDVDLGRKKDGTRRRAEGGEFFAVINKRSSRKYRGVIPDVIKSLNNDTFAQKYLNAYKGAEGLTVNVSSQDPSLARMADGIDAIREQGLRRIYTDPHGRTIIVYKNRTRIIRN